MGAPIPDLTCSDPTHIHGADDLPGGLEWPYSNDVVSVTVWTVDVTTFAEPWRMSRPVRSAYRCEQCVRHPDALPIHYGWDDCIVHHVSTVRGATRADGG